MGGEAMPAPEGLNPGHSVWNVASSVAGIAKGSEPNAESTPYSGVVNVNGTYLCASSQTYPNGAGAGVLRSTDGGVTWSFSAVGTTHGVAVTCPIYADGKLLCLTEEGSWASTDAGATWAFQTGGYSLGYPSAESTIAYGNGVWVVLTGTSPYTYVSGDGASWTAHNVLPKTPAAMKNNLIFDGSYFVCLLGAGTSGVEIAYSADGIAWTAQAITNLPNYPNWIDYADGLYMMAGDQRYWLGSSIAGLAAATAEVSPGSSVVDQCCVTQGGRILLVKDDCNIYESANEGTSWAEDTVDWTPTPSTPYGYAYISRADPQHLFIGIGVTGGAVIGIRPEQC
jgi:hypothetical protein